MILSALFFVFFDRKLQAKDFGPNGISISPIQSAFSIFMHALSIVYVVLKNFENFA
jgi:hypothetical protein